MKANKPLSAAVRVGDLVEKILIRVGFPVVRRIGIIIELHGRIARVCWGSYGTFLTPVHSLKLFTPS